MTGIVALSPVFNAMLPDAIQVQQRYDRHCCIEPVSAENPIRTFRAAIRRENGGSLSAGRLRQPLPYYRMGSAITTD